MPKRLPIRPIFSKKPSKNIYEWWDPKAQRYVKCAGFEIDLWDNASGTRLRRRVKADYQTAKENHRELAKLVQDGNESLPALIKRDKVRTLGNLLNRYEKAKSEPSLKNRQVRSPLTVKRTQVAVRGFIRALGGDPTLRSITPSTIERYISRCVDSGRKRGGINANLRTLKALFNWATKRDYLPSNPFKPVEMFPVERNEPRPLTPAELERLFRVCPPGSRWYPLVMVYLLTGARLSEVLKPKLSWRDIDFENEILTLPVRKNHKSTEFPLNEILLELFRELKKRPYTKAHDSKQEDLKYPFPFNASYISHKIKAILNSAKIDATVHDLRDSFVSHLIYLGYPIEDVSKIAGHSTIKITEQHYYKQLQERRREMLTDLGQHITGQPKTLTKNVDKTRPRVPHPDQNQSGQPETEKPPLPSEIETLALVTRGGIEPPTNGLKVRCSTDEKSEKKTKNADKTCLKPPESE